MRRVYYRSLIGSLLIWMGGGMLLEAQISQGGTPASFGMNNKSMKEVPKKVLSVTQKSNLALPDTGMRNKSLTFAYAIPVEYTPANSGVWDTLDNGDRIWRLSLQSEGAYSLNLVFGKYDLPAGAKLFVYDPEGAYVLGGFGKENNNEHALLALMPVPGDEVVVEYDLPAGISGEGALEITKVGHDFLNIFPYLSDKDGQYSTSGECNFDVSCFFGNDWQKTKRAVVRLLIDGMSLCSGVMLNNTARDGVPYLYTANHCIEDEAAAAATVALFNYESPYCNGPDGSGDQSVSGASLKALNGNLDFVLMELNSSPPKEYHPWYAGWSAEESGIEWTAGIHHPSGDVKKISLDEDAPVTATYYSAGSTFDQNGFWRINDWEYGTTEGGSSGSPLFNQDQKVIGVLNGGLASCGYSYYDYYTKTARGYEDYSTASEQLKAWLDPASTGETNIEGMDPYGDDELEAAWEYNTTHICNNSPVVFTDLSSGEILSWSWDFGTDASPSTASGQGPHEVVYSSGGDKAIRLIVESATDKDTLDQTLSLTIDSEVTSGFTYSYNDLHYTFTDQSENATAWYWEFGDGYYSIQRNPSHTYSTGFDAEIIQRVTGTSCYDTSSVSVAVAIYEIDEEGNTGSLIAYPMPAPGYCYLRWSDPTDDECSLYLYDSRGVVLRQWTVAEGTQEERLGLEGLAPGMYFLRLRNSLDFTVLKLLIE